MVEELKEILKIVENLPHMVMWVLAGILFYKTIIIGSVYSLIRFCVGKAAEMYRAPKIEDITLKIGRRFIQTDGTYDEFLRMLDNLKAVDASNTAHMNFEYLFKRDVLWLKEAIREKKEREANP